MDYDKRPIGVFDSGVGGLTVVKEIIELLPNEDIVYFGDTARVPYGAKSVETITKFSKQIMNFLLTYDVKIVVVACNTVSSNLYDILKREYDIPIIEVVLPGAASCAETTRNKKVGVIGTEATIKSGAYESKINEIDGNIQVFAKACPLFVPLAEEGWLNNEVTKLTASKYLAELINHGIDSLVLGCTHYPLLRNCIESVVGKGIEIVNPATVTTKLLQNYLKKNNLVNHPLHENKCSFFVSDNTSKFDDICKIALNKTYQAKKVDIEKF